MIIKKNKLYLLLILLIINTDVFSKNKQFWLSNTTGTNIEYKIYNPQKPRLDADGNLHTVVYLVNLPIKKIGRNKNSNNINHLLEEGYRVVEFNYQHNKKAISPQINKDIIAINNEISSGSFIGVDNCSHYRSYVLFEGYLIKQDIAYFVDNPKVYNSPKEYTVGDSLYMDIIYPANARENIPVVLSFSYSNSFATWDSDSQKLVDTNKHQRCKLSYTFAGFNDSFLEGLPANGIAWAIADHPKYCEWGKGMPENGVNNSYKSFQTNPDAICKVKSAIRTLRAKGSNFGLSGNIGIFGFSRGSTAGSLAIGDKFDINFESSGLYLDINDDIQAAILGPGVFDYTKIYDKKDDGDRNLETYCPLAWGDLKTNRNKWITMGADYLIETSATAPTFFFYNTTDEIYYADQIKSLKTKLDSLGVETHELIDYGTGHSVPQHNKDLNMLYDFLKRLLF